MADVHNPEVRSYNMSRIRAKDSMPELLVRKFLHSKGFRFRIHDKHFPGKPDIVLPKYRTIILVHGCFWHGHNGCKRFVMPKSRQDYWIQKIENNIRRDDKNKLEMLQKGWRVITVWECELKKEPREKTLSNLEKELRN